MSLDDDVNDILGMDIRKCYYGVFNLLYDTFARQ